MLAEIARIAYITKQKLGRGLASLTASSPAILATNEAAAADETGAAMRLEQTRYERAILDFETSVRRQRDAMHADHLARMGMIFQEAGE
jgi:hypothetical protein